MNNHINERQLICRIFSCLIGGYIFSRMWGSQHVEAVYFGTALTATSLFLVISFILCVAFDLLFPSYAMYQSWQALVPGFVWLSWKSFLIGLIETWAYGWYFALIWVPIYNFVALNSQPPAKPCAVFYCRIVDTFRKKAPNILLTTSRENMIHH